MLYAFFATLWGTQNWSQFWLLEYRNKLIGYARLSNKGSYSVLHHLYIAVGIEQNLGAYLVQEIDRQVTKLIYVACATEDAKLYINIGFTPIAVQDLPKKLQFGASINLQWGGINLAYLSN